MRKALLFVVLTAILSMLVGCGSISEQNLKEQETVELTLLPDFEFDEENQRFIHPKTGVWFLSDGKFFTIPSEQYVTFKEFDEVQIYILKNNVTSEDMWFPKRVELEYRPDEVWRLVEIKEVSVQEGDYFYTLSRRYTDLGQMWERHFRMDHQWYVEQVKKLNDLEDINLIHSGGILRIPLYVDKESIN
jgi:hypothetical protein